tara:strand:+ start:116 stop:739 length:624 start_codon:yes stop_codon:yes gene_type:complete
MTLDFFIHLTLATHKVADILPEQDILSIQIKDSATKLLAGLVLLAKENPTSSEQKLAVTPSAIRELGVLIAYLNYAKRTSGLKPENFSLLEQEYSKVGEFLRTFHEDVATQVSTQVVKKPELVTPKRSLKTTVSHVVSKSKSQESLSGRQTRILELLRNKDKIQVWELQKVLPEVTKRTLRRDLDDLLQRQLIIRQGEWNEVFYQIR